MGVIMAEKTVSNDGTIITCDAAIAYMLRSHFPGIPFPAWGEPDPMAALPQAGACTRVLLSYGGFHGNDRILDALPQIALVHVLGAGYDGFDPRALRDRGILLANAGDLNSDFVADHVMALALAVNRRVIEANEWVRSGQWARREFPPLRSFSGQRAGIVGLGNIGQAVARRLAGFDMPVSWWGPREKPGEPLPRADSLLALARDSDLLVVCCIGGPDTHRLIDAEVIDALGPAGVLVSVARGSVVDEDALIAALKDGRLGSAGLDVFEEEPTPPARWAAVPNVVLTPHHGAVTKELGTMMPQALSENIHRFLAGQQVANLITR
jgi:lactate dehydrogenase-like 2-hydroxyacid dehydrogenase